MVKKGWLLAAMLAICSVPALAGLPPRSCAAADCVAAEQARADLRSLYATMRESHFNLYARVSEAAYDAHLKVLTDSVTGPMGKPAFNLLLQRLLAFGRVGHARTDAPVQDALAHVQSGGKVLPLNVTIKDGAMLLDDWADAEGKLAPGSEIVSISRTPVPELYRQLRTIVSADTDQLLQAQVEQGLPLYLYLLLGPVERARVETRSADGRVTAHDVAAVDFATMKSLRPSEPVEKPALDPGKRDFRMIGDKVAFLRPGPFGNVEGEASSGEPYDPAPFEAFLTKAFERFESGRAADLIIDLRGNQGGDNSFSDLMIARIADRPFRFASRFQVKASAANKSHYAMQKIEPGSLMELMAARERRAPNGTIYTVDLPLVEPRTTNRFDGRVWVLIDRHSYSNAAVVAATIQDYGFGELMGEATADLATTFGSVEHFELRKGGVSVAYPKSYMVRPSGDETVRGVQPDIGLPGQPIDDRADKVLEAALAHIARAKE